MLRILLLILKIAGWVILGIVCLFLTLLLLVLFVPVPYRLQAEFGDSFSFRLRVFGIQVFPKKERPEKKKHRPKKTKARAGEDKTEKTAEPQEEPDLKVLPDEEPVLKELPEREKPPDQPGPPKEGDGQSRADVSDKGRLHRERKKGRGTEKSGKAKQGKTKRGKWNMDFGALREKWALVRAEFADEGNRRALLHGISETAYLLKHFGPRRVKADIAYSLADPANTGYATAAVSLCPFVYTKGCSILPDFESEKLYARGWVDVRGHVRLVHFGVSGVRLIIDRDIRAIIKKIRH